MQAEVIKKFIGKQEAGKAFAVKSTWEGSRKRFEEINAHPAGPFLKETSAPAKKEAKVQTQTKELKPATETKTATPKQQ